MVGPGAVAAAQQAASQAFGQRDQVRDILAPGLEAARYAADRAFRQYDAADPAKPLVAGELEARWHKELAKVSEIEGSFAVVCHEIASKLGMLICDHTFSDGNLRERALWTSDGRCYTERDCGS